MGMQQLIGQAQKLHIVRDVDLALLDFMYRRGSNPISDYLAWAILLVSRHSAMGHVCVDLKAVLAEPLTYFCLPIDDQDGQGPNPTRLAFEAGLTAFIKPLTLSQWIDEISASEAVTVIDHVDSSIHVETPFVLDLSQSRALFYLTRYWQCEQQLAGFIEARSQHSNRLPEQATAIIKALFPNAANQAAHNVNWQRVAVALAARSHCAIITGGPGTGKTTTVLKLLALLQALQLTQGLGPLHIKLAAPTGKAAARLNASIASNLQQQVFPTNDHFDGEQLKAAIPTEVSTLHRLLGPIANSRQFRHHATNPIAADVIVIDEASMVDLEMMANLVQALDKHTRLILLGDKDQLASVEAGSVLGDLCADASKGHYLPETIKWLNAFTGDQLSDQYVSAAGRPLAQSTTMLRVSHRFQQGGSIDALASLVNAGLYEGQPSLLPVQDLYAIVAQEAALAERKKRQPQVQLFHQPSSANSSSVSWLQTSLAHSLQTGYSTYLKLVEQGPEDDQDQWASAVLAAHASFQLLVALRRGQWGVEGMNATIEYLLQKADLLPNADTEWYPGRPVMVSRNDYHLGLMNGDIGVCLPYTDKQSGAEMLRVAFSAGAEGIRWVLPSRLRAVETVFALTVHKSQGSEFSHTMLMLPAHNNPVLTKELLYTGITRARQCFSLVYGDEQVLEQAMTRKVVRASGLSNRF